MFKKLFGQTEEQELAFLQKRLIISAAVIVACGICALIGFVPAVGAIAVVFLVWGWYCVRGLLGYATIGALFSRNVMVGVLIFLALIIVGYIIGLFTFILGVCRFTYLKTKQVKKMQSMRQ